MTTVADRLDAAHRVLAGRSADIEAAGRLPDDVVAAVRATGIFRMWLPCELGGAEARPAEVIGTLSALAAQDAAAGWCAGIGMASNLVAGYLPRNGAEELFATGDEITAGSLMPAGRARRTDDGDLLVSGQWPFGSGAHHSDWLAGGVLLDTGGAPEVRLVLFPRHQVDLLEGSWEVAGLRGTGSVDYRVTGAVVPERRSVRPASLSAWPAGAMWRIPVPEPGHGEFLVEVTHVSIDPAMRGWMNDMRSYVPPVGIGEVMRAGAVGRIVASEHSDFAVDSANRVAPAARATV